jgi:hypothetical protein
MHPTDRQHDNITEKRPNQDVFEDSKVAPVAAHDHGSLIPRRRSPPVSTWSTLIFASIGFGLIFIFSRFLPSWPNSLLMPFLSGATSDHEMTFSTPSLPNFSSNGRTDQVQWDNYTLVLQGQRVLI